MFQDGKLSISQCIKKDNGKVCVVEPLDELLSCVSWILLLQPQTKSDVRSDSWASLGFSLTQDSQVIKRISLSLSLTHTHTHKRTKHFSMTLFVDVFLTINSSRQEEHILVSRFHVL